MQNLPPWLPQPLVPPNSHLLGDTDKFLKNAEASFLADFSDENAPQFEGKSIKIHQHCIGNFNASFWHVVTKECPITKSKQDEDRVLDSNRWLLTPWLNPLLNSGELVGLKSRIENGRLRLNLNWWANELGYRIILEDRKYCWRLITAFYFSPKQISFQNDLLALYPTLDKDKSQLTTSMTCYVVLKNQKSVISKR